MAWLGLACFFLSYTVVFYRTSVRITFENALMKQAVQHCLGLRSLGAEIYFTAASLFATILSENVHSFRLRDI